MDPVASTSANDECAPSVSYDGKLFANYYDCFEELETLASGTSAETIKVKHKGTGKLFVLKKLRLPTRYDHDERVAKLAPTLADLQKIDREVDVLRELSHDGNGSRCQPSVACYYDRFVIVQTPPGAEQVPTERYALLMEYIDGPTLAQLARSVARKKETLPPAKFAALLKSASEALQYVHSRGVAHGDLKPENIMVTEEGTRAVLVDFALSCYALGSSTEERRYVCSHVRGGTPAYMAPEVLRAQIDGIALEPGMAQKGDVWALGASLAELGTGRVLFDAAGTADMYVQVKDKPLPQKLYTASDGSAAQSIDAALRKALERDWRKRASAAELGVAASISEI